MYLYEKNEWIKKRWADAVDERRRETKVERDKLDLDISILKHKRSLKTLDMKLPVEDEIAESLLVMLSNSKQKDLLKRLKDTSGGILTLNEIKGTLFSAIHEVREAINDKTHPLRYYVEQLATRVPVEAMEDESENIESSEDDFDETDGEEDVLANEQRFVDITPIREVFLTLLDSLDGVSLDALDAEKCALESRREQFYADAIRKRFFYEAILEKIKGVRPTSEILLVSDDVLDEDLKNVMTYRHKKNPSLLVLDLQEYAEALEHANKYGLESQFPSIKKLGILHHSGERVLSSGYDYKKHLVGIGDSLPCVSSVVLRGCGMVDEPKAKKLAIAAAQQQDDKLAPAEAKKKIKDGMLFFKPNDTEERHGKIMRQFTLDVGKDEGLDAATSLSVSVVKELEKSSIGKDIPKEGRPRIKCYVAGYQADPDKGLIAHRGSPQVEDRYLTAPKAIRFKI